MLLAHDDFRRTADTTRSDALKMQAAREHVFISSIIAASDVYSFAAIPLLLPP